MASWKCPTCGNVNRSEMEDNGCSGSELTMLCVARVPFEQSTAYQAGWTRDQVKEYDPETDTCFCGEQWDPYEEY